MAETPGTFSESWYRIADRHAALRPHLNVRRQYYRGERWHVIQDPINNQLIRLLAQLYSANLLHSDMAADSAQLFERYRKRREREIKSRLLSIMFARIPLL